MLQIMLLGGVAVTDDSKTIAIGGLKDRALLAYLASNPGTPIPRTKLASLLWNDVPERQGRDSLKQSVWRLRRALGSSAAAAFHADRQTLVLDRELTNVDASKFCGLLAGGEDHCREEAIALYRGEFLEGLDIRSAAFEDWVLVERQRLRHLACETMAALIEQQSKEGRRDRAAKTAQQLLALEPLHEGACRALMRSHAERAQRSQALKLFETLRQRLREEIGVRPEPETVALYEAIRGGALIAKDDRSAELDLEPKPTIAVLPFSGIGNDPEQDYFAAGLTEDVVTDLSRISGLVVVSRHKVPDTTQGLDAKDPARRLDVCYLLEGSVRKAGERMRINVQLRDGASGAHVWAARYDREMSDIFSVQDEIARSVAEVLHVRLLPHELTSITERPTNSPEAYELYLLARSFYLRGINRGSLRIARDLFAKARELDPLYARAYASIAICEYYLSMSDPTASLESMMSNSQRALELSPGLADAHAALGLAQYGAGQYESAAGEFDRAIELDPELFEAHFFKARCSRLRGMHEEAVLLFKRASELRPDDFRSIGLLAEQYSMLGLVGEFRHAALRCIACIEGEVKAHPDNAGAWAFGSGVLVSLGERERGEEWVKRAVIIGPDDFLVHYNVSHAYAMLGQHDRALEWLKRALGALPQFRNRLLAWLASDQRFDSLRGDPRFHSIVAAAARGAVSFDQA